MGRHQRLAARAVALVVVAAVAWPGIASVGGWDRSDGFPLSTYPMFTRDRGRVVEVPTAVALDAGGDAVRLPPTVIAATDQVLMAAAAVRRAVVEGPAAAASLCQEVASRAGGRGQEVAIVVERHDAIDWSAGAREPIERRVVATCPIEDGDL
jgi:hypothetical protein